MRKIIAVFNTTLDAICDHTAGIQDVELHQHYTELMGQGDNILYGRTTSLTKRYGFGVHYNKDCKIAIFSMETEEYAKVVAEKSIIKIKAVRSKRV